VCVLTAFGAAHVAAAGEDAITASALDPSCLTRVYWRRVWDEGITTLSFMDGIVGQEVELGGGERGEHREAEGDEMHSVGLLRALVSRVGCVWDSDEML
jgi:hypothetical protein